MKYSSDVFSKVVQDYARGDMLVSAIAAKHKVSQPTVSAWVKRAQVDLRGKGRRKSLVPSAQAKRVLELTQVMSYTQAAAALKTSKQNIGRIVGRWKGWQKPAQPPFEPGDLVQLSDRRKLCVIQAGPETGVLRDKNGHLVREFPWFVRGRPNATKVGHNPKFGQ